MTTTAAKITCPACNGNRYLTHFGHIEDGLCFTCNGAGIVSINHRAARPEVLTPAQIAARADEAKRAEAQIAFVATFAGMNPAAVADRLVNLSDAKVSRLHDVAINMNTTGAAEMEKGALEALYRRGLMIRRAA